MVVSVAMGLLHRQEERHTQQVAAHTIIHGHLWVFDDTGVARFWSVGITRGVVAAVARWLCRSFHFMRRRSRIASVAIVQC